MSQGRIIVRTQGPTGPPGAVGTIADGSLTPAKVAGVAVVTSDARLSDARTPTAHVHAAGDVTSGVFASARLPTLAGRLHNLAAATAPTTGDDQGDGYGVGSVWIDTTAAIAYLCEDATTNAAVWLPLVGKLDVQEFTANGTWTKPAWADARAAVRIFAIAGGGSGGSGRQGAAATARGGGGGGAAGSMIDRAYAAPDVPATLTVTVGAATTGAAAQAGTDGNGNAGTAGNPTILANGAWGVRAVSGGGGGGGTTAGGAGGFSAIGETTVAAGSAGGAAAAAGAVTASPGLAAGSGAGGGGITSADAATAAAAGGRQMIYAGNVANAGTAGAAGAAGGDATSSLAIPYSPTSAKVGNGGGGGGPGLAAAGGRGGHGSYPGGGGGGGGASLNGFASGAGGNGAAGYAIVITTLGGG